MSLRALINALLICLPTAAAPIGDFSPLQVGNTWEYTKTARYSNTVVAMEHDTITFNIQVVGSESLNDTTAYFIRTGSEGVRYLSYSGTYDPLLDTIIYQTPIVEAISEVRYDTLYEVNNSILSSGYLPIKPVWLNHFIDTATLDSVYPIGYSFDSIQTVNGKTEFSFSDDLVGVISPARQTYHATYKYRADVGLIYISKLDRNYLGENLTLVSFSNKKVAMSPGRYYTFTFTQHHVPAPTKNLNLPYLNITHRNKTFNLLGQFQTNAPMVKFNQMTKIRQ